MSKKPPSKASNSLSIDIDQVRAQNEITNIDFFKNSIQTAEEAVDCIMQKGAE